VILNKRLDCVKIHNYNETTGSSGRYNDVELMRQSMQKGAEAVSGPTRYWTGDKETLEYGETVTVENSCQGKILTTTVWTDKGAWDFSN
jgi:hypothetical protein